MKDSSFPWYTRVDAGYSAIEQGDILVNCKTVNIALEGLYEQIQKLDPQHVLQIDNAELEELNLIVLSQSCDLQTREDGKTTLKKVLLCAFHRHDQFPKDKDDKELDVHNIAQGRQPSYHLLPPCDLTQFERGLRIIDFRNLYVLPIEYLRAHLKASPHLRLMPPYREHLSQAFARFFMRVGLPSEIEKNDLQRLTP